MPILWVCWPRSGSTWASSTFARSIGIPWNARGDIQEDPCAVHRVHWMAKDAIKRAGNDASFQTILEIRDPRDTVVSYYYKILHEREEISIEDLPLLEYIKGNFLRLNGPALGIAAAEPGCSWAQFYRDWAAEGVDAEVRHEDMLNDPEGEIVRLADEICMPIEGDVSAILREYPDTMRPAYTREYTERQRLARTVPRGESRWYERLSGIGQVLIERECADIMKRYGYE